MRGRYPRERHDEEREGGASDDAPLALAALQRRPGGENVGRCRRSQIGHGSRECGRSLLDKRSPGGNRDELPILGVGGRVRPYHARALKILLQQLSLTSRKTPARRNIETGPVPHTITPVSRRFVLAGAAMTTASLIVPIRMRGGRAAETEITDWIAIAANGEVTLALSQPEVGQGSYTALPQILADELDADWQRVRIRFATGKAAYKIAFRQEPPAQKEGASMSTTALYERLRTAGAAARDALTRAAAQTWNVAVGQCRTEQGGVINARGDKLSYGELAVVAARLPLNAAPRLKDSSRFQLIGKPLARLDTPAKCNGSAIFGIDVVVPGMLNAAIKTAPSFSGELTAIKNEADILKMAGVRAVVKIAALALANEDAGTQHPQVPHLPRHNAVCVVADQFWQAKRALDALDVTFDAGAAGDLSTAKIDAMLAAAF